MHALEAREQRNALGAALLMHGLLAAGLVFSMSWNPKPPPLVQVELWSIAPAAQPTPVPEPAPEQLPAPEPASKVVSKPATPPPPPPKSKADISVQKKPEPPKRDLKEEARREAAKKAAEKRAAEKKAAEKKAADQKAAQKKLADEKAAQRREAIRKAELAKLLKVDTKAKASDQGKDMATKAGASQGAEIGEKTGVDADYVGLIQARIRTHIRYAERTAGNPEAIVIVEQLPSGEVTQVRLTQSSGVPTWDDAVQRAIVLASPLPKKKDGTVVRTLELRFRLTEAP